MAGFSNLTIASQQLSDVLKSAYVGMVPCFGIGEFDSDTEKWEKILIDKLNEIKLLNSKAILVNASLQKDEMLNVVDEEETATERLCNVMDSRMVWRNAVRAQAMSRAVKDCYRENRTEEMMIIKDLSSSLFEKQRHLEEEDQMEVAARERLAICQQQWRDVCQEYSVKSRVNYLQEKNIKDAPINQKVQELMERIQIMRNISIKLMLVAPTYDWVKDPAKLQKLVRQYRTERITPEFFS